jgi:SAM-dependent methyltransferase
MNFPLLYHTHYSHHLEDLPFWLDLADRQGSPVLELGCGTGRVLLPLVGAGHRTFGLDSDFTMLSLLKDILASEHSERITGSDLTVPIFQADLRCFHLDSCFELILLPCNTWSTFDPPERASALEQIRSHLSPKGLFVASAPNPQLLIDLPDRAEAELEESFEHPLSGNPVQVSSAWERKKDHLIVAWYYDHLLPDGNVERLRVNVAHHLSTKDAYVDELLAAGLQISGTWGDFNCCAYSADSPYLILAAKKN